MTSFVRTIVAASAACFAAFALAGQAAAAPEVLLAAGDIAGCTSPGDEATAAILDNEPGVVAALGDIAYPDGTVENYTQCYDPSWGRHRARTRPAVGNHEYRQPGAWPYFAYFGAAAGNPSEGWYSYDLGAWHVVVLNSNCDFVGGCAPGSPQDAWLRADLAANPAGCTLAYFHHARFSSGRSPQLDYVEPLWAALFENGVELVLSGHDHIYERHAPQTPAGDPNTTFGIRQFVVGTGGHSHSGIVGLLPSSQVLNNDTFGILKLTLDTGRYDWQFLPEAGRTFTDSGSSMCHAAPADKIRPGISLLTPSEGAVLRGQQTLTAEAADNAAVARVDFLVDSTVIGRDTTAPYSLVWDSPTFADGSRTVRARAVDSTGNSSTTAARGILIDNTLPETTIVRSPLPAWRMRTATLVFDSEPGATFECSLDRKKFAACASPVRLAGLAEGAHVFSVRARDAAGNLDPTPAATRWTVDVKAPATRIDFGRMSRGIAGKATFTFAASERGSGFACSLDGGKWSACVSPVSYAGVLPGRHEFRVRATDVAGNTDWIPAAQAWRSTGRGTGVVLVGGAGRDVLVGTNGDDLIQGLDGHDVLVGRLGDDRLDGGEGDDRLLGGANEDRLAGGPGRDDLRGQKGRDVLLSRDGERDRLHGGPARDSAVADRLLDRLRAVETRG